MNVDQIIKSIRNTHGEVTLAPGQLLALVAEIDRLSKTIDELNDEAFNAACDRREYH